MEDLVSNYTELCEKEANIYNHIFHGKGKFYKTPKPVSIVKMVNISDIDSYFLQSEISSFKDKEIKYSGYEEKGGFHCFFLEYRNVLSITDQLKEKTLKVFHGEEIVELAVVVISELLLIHKHSFVKGIKCDNIFIERNKKWEIVGVKFFGLDVTKKESSPNIQNTNNDCVGEDECKKCVFSFGRVLFEMALGLEIFEGVPTDKDIAEYEQKLDAKIISNNLRRIIQHCTKKGITDKLNGQTEKCMLKALYESFRREKDKKKEIKPNDEHYFSLFAEDSNDLKRETTSFKHLLLPLYDKVIGSGELPNTVETLQFEKFNQVLVPEKLDDIYCTIESPNGVLLPNIIPGSIPLSVTRLCFKEFNQRLERESIPESVTDLDLGDKFDIQSNLGSIFARLDSGKCIKILKTGFKFSTIEQLTEFCNKLPETVSDLQLYNCNLSLRKDIIPKSVKSLTLGSNFKDIKSLDNLPKLISLTFGTSKISSIQKLHSTLIIINGNKVTYQFPEMTDHNDGDWKNSFKLGEGGSGKVFRATFQGNHDLLAKNEEYVYKIVPISSFNPLETKILETLKGEHSMKFYGSGRYGDNIYIYMEYNKKAKSIADLRNSPYSRRADIIIKWATEIALALANIHKFNIIHRDIKCEHIFLSLDDDGNITEPVKFIDFGIAKKITQSPILNTTTGTQYYRSPEANAGKPNLKSDVYSLGIVISLMISKLENKDTYKPILDRCLYQTHDERLDAQQLHTLLRNYQDEPLCQWDEEDLTQNPIPTDKKRIQLKSFNSELTLGLFNGIQDLSLPSFNKEIPAGVIPSSVTKLSFKVFNQEIGIDSIPSSVKYLDLGDDFDIQNNGSNLPEDSILTLRCGFKFTKILNSRTIPLSVTDLQLYNYNIQLAKNSIPKSVLSLTLGPKFVYAGSLEHLPPSIINFAFGIGEPNVTNINNILNKQSPNNK